MHLGREGLLYISEYTEGIYMPTKEAFSENERERARERERDGVCKELNL